MLLTYGGVSLACGLVCGGYGFLSALVFFISIAVTGGGVYFLLKAFRKGRIKHWREMDKAERKKEWKRYLFTTLAMLAAFIIFF